MEPAEAGRRGDREGQGEKYTGFSPHPTYACLWWARQSGKCSLEGLVHWGLEQRRVEGGSLSQGTSDEHSSGGRTSPGWPREHLKSTLSGTVAIPPSTHSRASASPDGCSSHNTAMAVAALGGFISILAELPPADGELRPPTPTPPSSH